MAHAREEGQTQQTKETAKPEAELAPSEPAEISRFERSSPFSMIGRFMEEMDRLMSGFGGATPTALARRAFGGEWSPESSWSPEIETFEREGHLVFRADLPGLSADDVKVEIVDNEIVLSGERTKDERREVGGRVYSERRYGSFERHFSIPEGCDPETVNASFDNGVLEVSLKTPEREKQQKKRTVEIKKGSSEGGPTSIH